MIFSLGTSHLEKFLDQAREQGERLPETSIVFGHLPLFHGTATEQIMIVEPSIRPTAKARRPYVL
ncbi:hypothetical protein [Herbidospora daliensis]|uniref:hypothetical protein n=1 Tax=Herbidospora daliensis TaxID=295585 RepID=UPI0012FB3A15|nr:hypothetical protein [Herbidospora daliensis]